MIEGSQIPQEMQSRFPSGGRRRIEPGERRRVLHSPDRELEDERREVRYKDLGLGEGDQGAVFFPAE
jgi:hypothetical protein